MKFNTLATQVSNPVNLQPQRRPIVVFCLPGKDFTPGFFDSWTRFLLQSRNLPFDIIVSRHYLGSINHSLLTAEVLKKRDIKIAGWIFIGEENKTSESIILKVTDLPMIARIPLVREVTKEFVSVQAAKIASQL